MQAVMHGATRQPRVAGTHFMAQHAWSRYHGRASQPAPSAAGSVHSATSLSKYSQRQRHGDAGGNRLNAPLANHALVSQGGGLDDQPPDKLRQPEGRKEGVGAC